MNERAPRKKKRLSCEIVSNGSRYSGIAIDLSATGLFVQTNVKPMPGSMVKVGISLPGVSEPVAMEARVARKKIVPPELLTLAHGGVGLAFVEPNDAYLDFVAEISPEHADAVEKVRAKPGGVRRKGGTGKGAGSRGGANGATAASRFRIHAVETASGKRNSFLVACATEQEASDEVSKQLGDEWQVLFIERA
jgi:Tfp pilus assembly protein PilZ